MIFDIFQEDEIKDYTDAIENAVNTGNRQKLEALVKEIWFYEKSVGTCTIMFGKCDIINPNPCIICGATKEELNFTKNSSGYLLRFLDNFRYNHPPHRRCMDAWLCPNCSFKGVAVDFDNINFKITSALPLTNALKEYLNRNSIDEIYEELKVLGKNDNSYFSNPLPKGRILDDTEFEKTNPDHPYCESKRFRRQDAAVAVKNFAKINPNFFDDNDQLTKLHKSLFDCSAAVRHDIAETLLILEKTESLIPLQKLVETEHDRSWASDTAREAIKKIRANKNVDDDSRD